MALRQNSFGYWATDPGSEWLQSDYGIGPGFYDTRFNTEMLEIYLKAAHKFGGNLFEDAVDRYLAFYTQYADTNHIATENGGWLIRITGIRTHMKRRIPRSTIRSPNVWRCITRQSFWIGGRAFCACRPDLLAIEDTGSQWVMPDHNLYYSIRPDGTYAAGDYPYLTYNDLLHLRGISDRQRTGRNGNADLSDGGKLQWMTANGVTGYEASNSDKMVSERAVLSVLKPFCFSPLSFPVKSYIILCTFAILCKRRFFP